MIPVRRQTDEFDRAIEALGAGVAIMPPDNFHMKPLVNAICAAIRPPGEQR